LKDQIERLKNDREKECWRKPLIPVSAK
jgi:hypothetical protein